MNWCSLSCYDWAGLECDDWISLECCNATLCINALGECSRNNLSGVVVTVTNPSGIVVATGTISGSQLCFSLLPDTYTVKGVWNGVQVQTANVTVSAGQTMTSDLTFFDLMTITVDGCNGPIANAVCTSGGVTASTNAQGIATLSFQNAQPPPEDNCPVTVTIPTGPSQTYTQFPRECGYGFNFIDQCCVSVTGCSDMMDGAKFTISCAGDSFSGEFNGAAVCVVPTVDWTGNTITLTASQNYYTTGTVTKEAVFSDACTFNINLQPLPCYVCCACDTPVPTSINITDANGVHTAVKAIEYCQWFVCYGAPLEENACGEPGGTINVLYEIFMYSPTSMNVFATWGVRECIDNPNNYWDDPNVSCAALRAGSSPPPGAFDGLIYSFTQGGFCGPPISASGTWASTGQFLGSPSPITGGFTLSDGCTTSAGNVASVFARGNGPNPAAIGFSGYMATLSIESTGIAVQLAAYAGGTPTSLGTVSAIGGEGSWYWIQLTCQGSTISVTVLRATDGLYLQSNGSWSTTDASCITVTNTTVITAGYTGLGLQSSGTVVTESDNFAIPVGFSGTISEDWDEVTAPALPSQFIYNGTLVTNSNPPLAAISSPNVLEAPLNQSGYAAYPYTDGAAGNVVVSAWFATQASTGYYYYYGGGGAGLPQYVTVTFDSSPIWGALANQTVTIDYDPTLGDYPSLCLATSIDGGHCDGSGATEGLLTITLSQTSPGVVSATAQWTGGIAGSGCADGSCEYYGTASASGITQGGSPGILAFAAMAYQAGGVGSFKPNQTLGTPYKQDWDGVTAPALPSDWSTLGLPLPPQTSSSPPVAAESSPNVIIGTTNTSSGAQIIYLDTVDSSGGNVLVQADFAVLSGVGWGQLFGRVSNISGFMFVTGTWPSAYFVELFIDAGAGTAEFVLIAYYVDGSGHDVGSTLGTLGGVSISAGAYYTLSLLCDDSSIAVWVQRKSDGFWLQPTATWGAGFAAAIAVTDLWVEGSGLAAIGLLSGSSTPMQSDNFSVTPLVGSGSPATISLSVPT